MWVAKLRLKHDDCVIGRRCKRFNVKSIGTPINSYTEADKSYYIRFETFVGEQEKIQRLLEDLKEDPSIKNVEIQDNSAFFTNEFPARQKIPTIHNNPKIFFTNQEITDEQGYENWEITSLDEQTLRGFIVNLQKEHSEVKVIDIQNKNLNEVYSPKIKASLTKGQTKALELAKQKGYYNFPRNVELKDLAKEAGISLSTFREHLRKAEKKII